MKNIHRVLILLIWVGSTYTAEAQKPKDFYVSYPQPDGTLFHLFPISFFQHKTDGDLTFDITYQCGKDSAVINFTYYASQPQPLDSMRFVSGKSLLSGKATKIFIEAENTKKWAHRYSVTVPIRSLFPFFDPEEKPSANLCMNSITKGYELKKAEWSKKAPVFRTIMRMIGIDCEK